MKTQINAEIVAHSVNTQGDELISVLCTFPRIILAEVNTHRMLSKNTSSSRAIPFNKMVETIEKDPFIPIAWQRGHSGMQGSQYVDTPIDLAFANDLWLEARDRAVKSAKALSKEGTDRIPFVTKQLANRLLEPFMWTTMLITGPKSGWENFFTLRCPDYIFHTDEDEDDFHFRSRKDALKYFGANEPVEYPGGNIPLGLLTDLQWRKLNYGQAEIHIMDLAECIWDKLNESTPKLLIPGEWHIPFQDTFDLSLLAKTIKSLKIPILDGRDGEMVKVWVSTAMAARTSYTVVGNEKDVDYKTMIALHDRLLAQDPPHSSPLEHCAKAMIEEEYYLYSKGREGQKDHEHGWCNNLKGFIPYRYIIDNSLSL